MKNTTKTNKALDEHNMRRSISKTLADLYSTRLQLLSLQVHRSQHHVLSAIADWSTQSGHQTQSNQNWCRSAIAVVKTQLVKPQPKTMANQQTCLIHSSLRVHCNRLYPNSIPNSTPALRKRETPSSHSLEPAPSSIVIA